MNAVVNEMASGAWAARVTALRLTLPDRRRRDPSNQETS